MGDVTMNGVKVILADITPRPESFVPRELRFMHDDTEDGRISLAGVNILPNRLPSIYADIIATERDMEVCYADPRTSSKIPQRHYVFTVRAEAQGVH